MFKIVRMSSAFKNGEHRNLHTLLVGIQIHTISLGKSFAVSYNIKYILIRVLSFYLLLYHVQVEARKKKKRYGINQDFHFFFLTRKKCHVKRKFLLIIPVYSELCNEVCPYQVEKLGKSIFCYYSGGENGFGIGHQKPKQ